jgi:hypothetical protein
MCIAEEMDLRNLPMSAHPPGEKKAPKNQDQNILTRPLEAVPLPGILVDLARGRLAI